MLILAVDLVNQDKLQELHKLQQDKYPGYAALSTEREQIYERLQDAQNDVEVLQSLLTKLLLDKDVVQQALLEHKDDLRAAEKTHAEYKSTLELLKKVRGDEVGSPAKSLDSSATQAYADREYSRPEVVRQDDEVNGSPIAPSHGSPDRPAAVPDHISRTRVFTVPENTSPGASSTAPEVLSPHGSFATFPRQTAPSLFTPHFPAAAAFEPVSACASVPPVPEPLRIHRANTTTSVPPPITNTSLPRLRDWKLLYQQTQTIEELQRQLQQANASGHTTHESGAGTSAAPPPPETAAAGTAAAGSTEVVHGSATINLMTRFIELMDYFVRNPHSLP